MSGLQERLKLEPLPQAVFGAVSWRVQRLLHPLYERMPAAWWPLDTMCERTDSLLDRLKMRSLVRLLDDVRGIPGDAVECGVYRGGSLLVTALWLEKRRLLKRVHGFDLFTGLPEPSAADDRRALEEAGRFSDTSLIGVQRLVERFGVGHRIRLVPGAFAETLAQAPVPLSFIHLDCDLYASYRTALEALWPKLSPGGIVVMDEFQSPRYVGARRAIDEFFAARPERPAGTVYTQGYVRKQ